MHLDDFQFQLPQNLIARYPLAKRSASRLLCTDSTKNNFLHRQFSDVIDLVAPGDLLIFNNTRVIPARLYGQKSTGGKIELLVERVLDNQRVLAQIRVSKPPKKGDKLVFSGQVELEVLNRQQQFYTLRYNGNDRTILNIIESIGHIPLPPYMQRSAEESDKERYQTVYATQKGSVAAPTAGLHFDEDLLQQLTHKQVQMGYLTLHIGAGTFAPVRIDDISQHTMHAEYFEVSQALCEQIKLTKQNGHRVIAVGTTSLRALEAASQTGVTKAYQGETTIFIYPGYQFNCVDALITNLHLPGSTLLMLVSAFGGHGYIMRAYQEAVSQSYRFYSYGDAMWIEKQRLY